MNCSLQHTANGHFSLGISQLRALRPKIMGNILQHSCVTFPLLLIGGMCPKSGCIHQQSELGITEAPNEHSSFIPSHDPPRDQPQLFTRLAQGSIYLVSGRAGSRGSRAAWYHSALSISPQRSLTRAAQLRAGPTGACTRHPSQQTASGLTGCVAAEAWRK